MVDSRFLNKIYYINSMKNTVISLNAATPDFQEICTNPINICSLPFTVQKNPLRFFIIKIGGYRVNIIKNKINLLYYDKINLRF